MGKRKLRMDDEFVGQGKSLCCIAKQLRYDFVHENRRPSSKIDETQGHPALP